MPDVSVKTPDDRLKRDVCLYFGTFNPVHTGHLMIAQSALNQFADSLGIRSVIFIPAAHPPHRLEEEDLLDARQRLKLVTLATVDHPAFEVNDIELRRTGPSYTIDTLRALHAQGKIHWPTPMIIGSDALAQLASWHEPDALIKNVCFLQIPRPGHDTVEKIHIPSQSGVFTERPLNTHRLTMPELSLSASWIRHQLKDVINSPRSSNHVSSLRYFLPDPVWHYIRNNSLYR